MTEALKFARHPLSDIFPDMEPDAWLEMLRTVQLVGVKHPIVLFEGKVLDGWHRQMAASQTGWACPATEFKGSLEDAKEFIRREHFARRNLDKSQRALAVVQINGFSRPQGRPPLRNPTSVKGNNPEPGSGLTEAQLASQADVSDRTIRDAKTVSELGSEELQRAVSDGRISVKAAAAVAKRVPRPEQTAAAQKAKDDRADARKWVAVSVPKPEVGATKEAHNDALEKLDILREELDRVTARCAVHFMEGTDEEKLAASAMIAELQAQVRGLEAEAKAIRNQRDGWLEEISEMRKQLLQQRRKIAELSKAHAE